MSHLCFLNKTKRDDNVTTIYLVHHPGLGRSVPSFISLHLDANFFIFGLFALNSWLLTLDSYLLTIDTWLWTQNIWLSTLDSLLFTFESIFVCSPFSMNFKKYYSLGSLNTLRETKNNKKNPIGTNTWIKIEMNLGGALEKEVQGYSNIG